VKRRFRRGEAAMWDVPEEGQTHLSHDRPCLLCGHAAHTFLPCGDTCFCSPQRPPVSDRVAA